MKRDDFDKQLTRNYRALLKKCYHLTGNREDAADLAGEAVVKALEARDTFNGDNMRGWLTTIARNLYINAAKMRKLVVVDAFDGELPEDGLNVLAPRGEGACTSDAYERAVDALPAIYREVFSLSEDGWRMRDIAVHLEIPLGTVKSRLHNARKKLRELL
ncbi:MAG TPA: RNA polymerase sigma factor [Bacillota bacterium]|nr:RNA polymerase sigma factor [Bacillota bacterium]